MDLAVPVLLGMSHGLLDLTIQVGEGDILDRGRDAILCGQISQELSNEIMGLGSWVSSMRCIIQQTVAEYINFGIAWALIP